MPSLELRPLADVAKLVFRLVPRLVALEEGNQRVLIFHPIEQPKRFIAAQTVKYRFAGLEPHPVRA